MTIRSFLFLIGLCLSMASYSQQLDIDQPQDEEFNFQSNLDFDTDIKKPVQFEYTFMNGYKYIYMPRVKGNRKIQGIYDLLKKTFRKKGIKIVTKKFRFWDDELKDSPGLCLYFDFKIGQNQQDLLMMNLSFQNVSSEVIKDVNYTSKTDDDSYYLKDVMMQFKDDFDQFKYEFDEKFFVQLSYAELEQISKNMKMVNSYFDKTNISYSKLYPVEGVYARSTYIPIIGKRVIDEKLALIKSYQDVTPENVPEWVLQDEDLLEALKDQEDFKVERIKVIVMNNINRIWNPGEIKGDVFVYEEDDGEYLMKGNWYFDNKKTSLVSLIYNSETRRIKLKSFEYKKIR